MGAADLNTRRGGHFQVSAPQFVIAGDVGPFATKFQANLLEVGSIFLPQDVLGTLGSQGRVRQSLTAPVNGPIGRVIYFRFDLTRNC